MTDKRMFAKRGFTLVEIIVAGLIISITALGSLSAYLYARQFSNKFRYRAHALSGAQEIAEYIRYSLVDGYRNNVDLVPGLEYALVADAANPSSRAVTDANLINILDPVNWQINTLVDNLAIIYTVENVYFDNNGVERTEAEKVVLVAASDPSMPATRPAFKKVTVRVNYGNRKVA